MANEINIQAALTVRRFVPAMQGCGSLDISQTGMHSIGCIQNIGTGAEALALGDCATLGYLFVKNLGPTNYVQLALDSGFTQIFAKLKVNEFCLVPCNQNTCYARANTAACDVMVAAAEV